MTATVEDLRALERLVNGLSPEKIAELEKIPAIAEQLNQKWIPNPGPQTEAYYSEADELFYGGEAGGGKSDILMGLSITAHKQSLLLRRTNKEASKFIKRFSDIIGDREGWNGQLATFALPSGRVVEMGGVQLEDDKQKYKGDPHDLIAFDEIADFTETQYRFIIGWNRSADKAQRCRVVCAGNPPTRPEGLWVFKYWGAWLDPTHPNPARDGELRWYTTINGEDVEVDGPGPHQIEGEPKPVTARSRTFIRAQLEDNPDLEESGYDAVLAALPDGLRQAYREGRFDVALKDDAFQVIPTAWILAAQDRWSSGEHEWRDFEMSAIALDCAGGGEDPAAIAWRYGGWFGEIVTIQGPETMDGSAMAGHVLKHRRHGCPIVIDVGGGYGSGPIERFKDNDISFVRFNAAGAGRGSAIGSGLKFSNKRAEAWWRFREALDPDQEGGSAVALPPDAELRAELAAPHYEVRAGGLLIEDKKKIRDRIGRSTNKADAVVMCLSEGDRAARMKLSGLGMSGKRRPQVILGYANTKRRRH